MKQTPRRCSQVRRWFAALLGIAVAVPYVSANELSPSDRQLAESPYWRFVGPMIGGRVNAVVGHPVNTSTAYAGYTGGGVWKTTDAGSSWANISDGGIRTGSIGAIDISSSNPDILFVGTGEHALRGDVSHGDGVYKSVDAGSTWQHVGLTDTRQISRVIIHPDDPSIVFVAALGHFAGPNPERGIFRTTDGGDSWEQVLFQDENAGAIDLEMDRRRPNVLFAATWEVRRFPWGIRSSGPGSRLYRSRDGGESWVDITHATGLPKSKLRDRIGLTLTESKQGRVYALISSDVENGLYRSDDDGESWQLMTSDVRLFARPYYYMHIIADPSVPNRVYVSAEELFRSNDGGATFEDINDRYKDHHDLWIDPNDSRRMIDGQDHGALLSYNGGITWSANNNQPTAQAYSLTTDNQFPYWLYGNIQDWGSYKVSSRPRGAKNGNAYEFRTANSEAGYTVMDPDNPSVLYLSDHHWLIRVNQDSQQLSYISPSDELHYGWGTADQEFRFNWVFPVIWSRHNGALYAGSQFVHRSADEGNSWQEISPDLTAASDDTLEKTPFLGRDTSANGPYWGPLNRDSNGDNWNSTLYTISESPLQQGLLWTGSDDGLVHVSTNEGRNWRNVTPPSLPSNSIISRIEPSPFNTSSTYIAAMRYRLDDTSPYLFRTDDLGKSWTRINNGFLEGDFVRVVRADPETPGLLFAGTESGVYFSRNNGDSWTRLQSGLPRVPVHDMQIKNGDLVIATHGRGFWIFDDISVFQQSANVDQKGNYLFKPRRATRFQPLQAPASLASPQTFGVTVNYFLQEPGSRLVIQFLEKSGRLIAEFDEAPNEKGLNRFVWKDQRYPGAEELENHPTRSSRNIGPRALPGEYIVRLLVDDMSHQQFFSIRPDPSSTATVEDLNAQFSFVSEVRDLVTEVNRTVISLRHLRDAIRGSQIIDQPSLNSESNELNNRLLELEGILTAYEVEYRMQYMAIPVRLDDKLYTLARRAQSGDRPPTAAQRMLLDRYRDEYERVRRSLDRFLKRDLRKHNKKLSERNRQPVVFSPHTGHNR